jgi:hypothetical protein
VITARSITLSNSRTLPGQWYSWRAFRVSFEQVSIFLPNFLLNLIDEQRDAFLGLPKWRDCDWKNIEPEE